MEEKLKITEETLALENIENKNQIFIFVKKLLLNIIFLPWFILSFLFSETGTTGPG